MLDYKELLRKYIDHVSTEEGTDFLHDGPNYDLTFTDEEWKELQDLSGRPWPISTEPLVRSSEYSKQMKDTLINELSR